VFAFRLGWNILVYQIGAYTMTLWTIIVCSVYAACFRFYEPYHSWVWYKSAFIVWCSLTLYQFLPSVEFGKVWRPIRNLLFGIIAKLRGLHFFYFILFYFIFTILVKNTLTTFLGADYSAGRVMLSLCFPAERSRKKFLIIVNVGCENPLGRVSHPSYGESHVYMKGKVFFTIERSFPVQRCHYCVKIFTFIRLRGCQALVVRSPSVAFSKGSGYARPAKAQLARRCQSFIASSFCRMFSWAFLLLWVMINKFCCSCTFST